MAIEKIVKTVYVTSDGTEFDSEAVATKWEAVCALREEIEAEYGTSDYLNAGDVAEYILDNYVLTKKEKA